jgi:crotonobetainyl-CoA hydratase
MGYVVEKNDASAYQYVKYEIRDKVAFVTINRPEVLNALHPPAHLELENIWHQFIKDDDLCLAVLSGAGDRAFCAGTDLKYRSTKADQEQLSTAAAKSGHILDYCWKPIIAAVNGFAVGGGLELALHCDIIIAAENAKFGFPEPRRGLLADEGGVVKILRRIPYHLAMGTILSGRIFNANEAYRIGLLNEIASKEGLMKAVSRWIDDILQCSPLAIQAAKQVAKTSLDLDQDTALNRMDSLDRVKALRLSEDYVEGPRAFAEKREPVWTGKLRKEYFGKRI